MKLENVEFPNKIWMGDKMCIAKDISDKEFVAIGWFENGVVNENNLKSPPYLIKIRRDWEEMPEKLLKESKVVKGYA
jgi:hypothetical protein